MYYLGIARLINILFPFLHLWHKTKNMKVHTTQIIEGSIAYAYVPGYLASAKKIYFILADPDN